MALPPRVEYREWAVRVGIDGSHVRPEYITAMRNRERQLWTEFVREREERKDKKPRRPGVKKKPEASQAELDAVLDDLTEAAHRRS